MGIFNHALPECTDTELDHGSVVQDLGDKKSVVSINIRLTVVILCGSALPSNLPVRVGQRDGCCPAGGSSASGPGPGTSASAERGGRCGRGWRTYGYGRCDPWRI